MILAPSILAADFTRLGEQITAAERAGAQYLHIDVMDGIFVPSISFGMPVIESIRGCTDMVFDVHLMIEEPWHYVEEFARCGAEIITFHLEAVGQERRPVRNVDQAMNNTPESRLPKSIRDTIELIKKSGCRAGLAIKPATPVEMVLPYAESLDQILIMTVEPGFGGQKYIDSCTDKIREMRKLLGDRGLSTDIQIDGGVTKDNIGVPLQAGANVIVAGSAVFHGDVYENVRELMNSCNCSVTA